MLVWPWTLRLESWHFLVWLSFFWLHNALSRLFSLFWGLRRERKRRKWDERLGLGFWIYLVLCLHLPKLLLCQISPPFNGEQICKICTSASRSPWWISFTLWASERRFAICLEIVVGELESLCKVLSFYEFIWLLSFIGQAWRLKFRQSACLPLSLGFCFFLPFFYKKAHFPCSSFSLLLMKIR